MTEDFADDIQVVRAVDPASAVEGLPAKVLWVAAVERNRAVDAVLAALPDGWTAELTSHYLSPDQAERLKLQPGEVRKLTP